MASIKDVAKLAGVSLSTVSIVVNGKSAERKISEATQTKVLEAMRELQYVPNVSAKTLRRGENQKYVVALFCSFDFRSMMMIRFLFGLQNKISETNADMNVVVYPYKEGELSSKRSYFNGSEFHAAIIANANEEDLQFLAGQALSVPVILYNRKLEHYSSVNVDDEKVGETAARHLLQKGYDRPAIIQGTRNFPGATKRMGAFLDMMEKEGRPIPEQFQFRAQNSLAGGISCAEEILGWEPEKRPDCFWCSSDIIAIGLANQLISGGVRIPQEAGIIAIGNIEAQFSRDLHPSITVVNIPMEKMAEGCFDYLVEIRSGQSPEPKRLYYETELWERDSTAKK